jgi:SAM-dependent methyltransferase
MDANEAGKLAADVARVLPPTLVPFFDGRFVRSDRLFDEYVRRLALEVVAETKLDAALLEWSTAADAAARTGLHRDVSLVPVAWMLAYLAARGHLARQDDRGVTRFRVACPLPVLDPVAVAAEQRAHDPACLPSYTLAETARRDYPAFLRGERSGEEILLAPRRLTLWTGYFSNDNPLYAVNNRVGAAALGAWMPAGATILELGGGLGSATAVVLEHLETTGRVGAVRYRFSELVLPFLRRAERLRDRFAGADLTFEPLDMNRPFAEQGVAPETVNTVYAVNALHVAHDLLFTLGEIRRALPPGGQVVLAECVRPQPGQALYAEFVFNLMETFRAPKLHPVYRPNGGFLSAEQWSAALRAAGFRDVRVMPDIARVRDVAPQFSVAAIAATRAD